MVSRLQLAIPVCVIIAIAQWSSSSGVYITNLTEECYRCLCYVSTKCDQSLQCASAWEDCARDYHCSKRIIEGYLQRFGKDCNGDGVTNCFDYMMVNGNGGYGCTAPLNNTANGRRWLDRFEECRHSL